MNVNQPAFRPGAANTSKLACTASTGRANVQAANASRHLRIYNAGTASAYVEAGAIGVVATVPTGDLAGTTGSMPIAPGTVEVIATAEPYLAAICDAGLTTTLYITPGEGL